MYLQSQALLIVFPSIHRLIFDLSLSRETFNTNWKQANVTPVFKKGDSSLTNNYRPISLLSVVSKVMERCIFKYLHNHLVDNSIITPFQSGFTHGDSAVNQLIHLNDTFCKALDQGKEVRVVFFDISKAFDRVWHKGLLKKLEYIGITGELLLWFENYLSNREQRVIIRNGKSDFKAIGAGVPQGSILGPILFLIFINDIVENISSHIRLFADDTTLFLIVNNPNETALTLNSDIDKIVDWSNKWFVTFNPIKTESLVISRKIRKPFHPCLYMDHTLITEVENHKHLGIIFSENGTWLEHINYIIQKANNRLNILRKLKFTIDRASLEKLYFSYIRPLLEYGDVIWCNIPNYLINQLENINIEAARIMTGATKLVSLNKLYEDTCWTTLESRRKRHRLRIFHKMYNKLTPEYLSLLIPSQNDTGTDRRTRQTDNIPTINCKTQTYYDSFLPATIRDFNLIPPDIKRSSTSDFKKFLECNDIKQKYYFNSGTRKGQILHTRLRLKCSSLNEHLYLKNIRNDPFCACGQIESNKHFLLDCPLYMIYRNKYFPNLPCTLTEGNLLYGDDSLSPEENSDIFKNVQSYIIDSKRFS